MGNSMQVQRWQAQEAKLFAAAERGPKEFYEALLRLLSSWSRDARASAAKRVLFLSRSRVLLCRLGAEFLESFWPCVELSLRDGGEWIRFIRLAKEGPDAFDAEWQAQMGEWREHIHHTDEHDPKCAYDIYSTAWRVLEVVGRLDEKKYRDDLNDLAGRLGLAVSSIFNEKLYRLRAAKDR